MGKEKKEKHKKDKDKKRRRDHDGDEERNREKALKMAKKVMKNLEKGGAAGHGYTNAENPFGDAKVSERFVWGKKIEKQLQEGADVRELTSKAERKRQEERLAEIEKVRKRREERAAERALQEEELSIMQRERAVLEGIEMEAKEEEFHLETAKRRAQQRMREGRAKPIDALAVNLFLMEEFDVNMTAPYSVFIGLSLEDVEELRDDIKGYQALDSKDAVHKEFWDALAEVAEVEYVEALHTEEADRARMRGEPEPEHRSEAGLHTAVDTDIQMLLAGKSHRELVEMEEGIQAQLDGGDAADPEFLAAVLKRLTLAKAKARLREIHEDLLRKHLDRIVTAPDRAEDIAAAMGWADEDKAQAPPERDEAEIELEEDMEAQEAAARLEPAEPKQVEPEEEEYEEPEEENVGQWSPRPLEPEHVVGQDVIPEEEDARLLDLLRKKVKYHAAQQFSRAAMQAAAQRSGGASASDRAYQDMLQDSTTAGGVHPMMRLIADAAPQKGEIAMRSGQVAEVDDAETQRFKAASARLMGDMNDAGDAPFRGEVQLDSKVYWWNEKYRPRKPKYFNRVHTGYEWNKYNQTHYDHDNPPPKVVQGYKFNIFYPDLINKDEAPTYSLEKDPDADEHGSTCLLIFHAGPPYEDTAFKILNKEWEYSHKKGFKSTFERGILHLYFNFKRNRYRR
ncbi:probable cactin [Coccomyxa sp. Obi]|nr:probable cactin [Coccomyxa sp. Obi]